MKSLKAIEPDIFADDEVQTRVKAAQEQFDACIRVKDLVAARPVYSSLLTASLGVGHKDYQVVGLLRWSELANAEDPEQSGDRIETAASVLARPARHPRRVGLAERDSSNCLQVGFERRAVTDALAV